MYDLGAEAQQNELLYFIFSCTGWYDFVRR